MKMSVMNSWIHVPTPNQSVVQMWHITLIVTLLTLELDMEAALTELLPEEGEMDGACEKNRLFLLL